MSRRWRPSLGFVLGGALAGTLALSQERGGDPAPPAHFGTRELHATARRVIAMARALRDREATIRSYTDHVTHEIKTPVSAIRAASELLEDGGTLSAGDAALLAQIDGARAQIEAQLTALRDAARSRETRYLGQTTLAELLPDPATDWPGLTVATEGARIPLPVAPEGMRIVLTQLLRNARENGATRARLRASETAEGPRLDLTDDGPGISPGNAARIFDPFFTTRRDDGGTGMGLSVVRNLLHAHGATIALLPAEPPATGGAHFTIRFAGPGD